MGDALGTGTEIQCFERDEDALVSKTAHEMRKKLATNRHKGHWSDRSRKYLADRIMDELREMAEAITRGASPAEVWSEAADVANFVAMLADNYDKERT